MFPEFRWNWKLKSPKIDRLRPNYTGFAVLSVEWSLANLQLGALDNDFVIESSNCSSVGWAILICELESMTFSSSVFYPTICISSQTRKFYWPTFEMTSLPFFDRKNIFNLCLVHLVAVPIIFLGLHVLYECQSTSLLPISFPILESLESTKTLSDLTCRVGLHHPLIFVNIIIFFFVCVVFWIISIYQNSTWLIGESEWCVLLTLYLFSRRQ